jgi:hypothetical protein
MQLEAKPQWIVRMYASKEGRDHLGLGSVSAAQILPTLSPAINVLTYHPRYYSFYAFLLDEFIRRERPASRGAWIAFYRPREFIFSVGAYLRAHQRSKPEHGQMGNIVGGQKTEPLARREYPSYNSQTDYMDSELGGYGLYYRTVMTELELIYLGGRGLPYPIDVPSEKGRAMAAAFREAVRDTVYYQAYFDQDTAEVPLEVIHEYIDRACLCQLQHTETPDRPLLVDAFLHGGSPEGAAARRATFRLLLDVAWQTEGHAIGEDTFRQLLYFQSAEGGITYQPDENVGLTYRRWRQYQAREYYSFALNAMWNYLCHWGLSHQGDIRPVPLTDFWDHLEQALDFDGLARRLNLPPPGIRSGSGYEDLLHWLTTLVGVSGMAFDAACGLNAPVQEHRLYRLVNSERHRPEISVAGMMLMLALIYLRFGESNRWQAPEWEIAKIGRNGRLPLHGYIQSLRRRIQSGPVTIHEIAQWLYRDYIILQHQAIANQKLPENTFRFQSEGGRLRFYNLENNLRFMDSRYHALATMVHELGFCGNLFESAHGLTAEGSRLLEEGDLP